MKNLKKPTPAGIKPETSASRSSAVNALRWDSRLSLRFRKIRSLYFLTAHGLTGYRPEEIRGLYMNFHYDGHHLQCITGTSLNTFTMDKSIEREWDQEVKNILKSRSIEGDY